MTIMLVMLALFVVTLLLGVTAALLFVAGSYRLADPPIGQALPRKTRQTAATDSCDQRGT